MTDDVLTWLDGQVGNARHAAALAVDRVEAFLELRSLALEFRERAGTDHLTVDDLVNAGPADEHERARLSALVARATAPPERI